MKKKWKSGLALFLAGVIALTPTVESMAANLPVDNATEVVIADETVEDSSRENENTVEIESESGTESIPETENETEIASETEVETENEVETEVETESEIETEPESETKIENETELETQIENETESETETEIATEPEIETESEINIEIETELSEETVAETETMTEEATESTGEEEENESGHKEPKLEMNLSAAMQAEKRELAGTAEHLTELRKGIEYVANEAVFIASSENYAKRVAEGYGASLSAYEDGLAIMTFEDEVTEIIAMAEDNEVKLPAVYPNYLYTVYGDVDTALVESDAMATASGTDAMLSKQYYHDEIHTKEAWNYNSAAGKGIKVAVIDSGINKSHEDLSKRVASVTVTHSEPYNKSEDNDGQGTHVAGIIAANRNNAVGGAGIAYNASIVSVKALEENPLFPEETAAGSTSSILKAVNASVKSGARVINMSFGGRYYDALLEEAVNEAVNKGIVVVAAAGDESIELSNNIRDIQNYRSPASFENVITVSSKKNGSSSLAASSNYGAGIVDITAPGVGILSSVPANVYGKKYESMSGTSQAASMVSATAAYILSVNSDLKNKKNKQTVDTIKKILQDSASKEGFSDASKFGAGLLNVEAAVKMAAPSKEIGTELQAPVAIINGIELKNNNKVQTIQHTDFITLSALLGENIDENVKIYYTLNGKTPTENSTLYTEPFKLEMSGNKTLKVIAVYYGKKSKVTTIKVKVNAYAQNFSITSKSGYNCVSSGKKLTLSAGNWEPSYTTKKKVQWSIISGGEYAQIDKNKGIVTAKNVDAIQKVTVQAMATDQKEGQAAATIEISIIPKVKSLSLKNAADKKEVQLNYPATKKMEVVVNPTGTPIVYSSSNSKVATVDPVTGIISTVGAGKATITAKTIDGSNKKVTMKVKVTKAVTSVKVTSKNGEYQVAAGKKLQMVATIPSDASDKKVKWSITKGAEGVSISDKGVLSVNKTKIKEVTKVTVRATAWNDARKYDDKVVTIYPVATDKITMEGNKTTYHLGTINKGDLKTGIQLYPYSNNYTDGLFGRKQGSGTTNLDRFTYKSTNTKVATVSEKGLVTAKTAGTAKIKITARDGSGKSFTCTIKVLNPVIKVAVYSKSGVDFLAKGKTMSMGALVYGNASNNKIEWTTSNKKIATVSAGGKVTGKEYGTAVITAKALDGSGTTGSFTITIKPLIKKLGYLEKAESTNLKTTISDVMYVDEHKGLEQFMPYYVDESSSQIKYEDVDSLVSWKSTNINVIQIVRDKDRKLQVVAVNPGKAELIFKALDGSGKTAKVKITVK